MPIDVLQEDILSMTIGNFESILELRVKTMKWPWFQILYNNRQQLSYSPEEQFIFREIMFHIYDNTFYTFQTFIYLHSKFRIFFSFSDYYQIVFRPLQLLNQIKMKRQQRDTKNYAVAAKSSKIVQNITKEVKSISELPSDILLKIFAYLPARDILNLDRVSKKFQLFSRQPQMITRVHFSEMTGTKIPLLFVPGDKFKQIHGFLKFLKSERTTNVTSLDVNYDIFDKGTSDLSLLKKYIKNWREDFSLALGMKIRGRFILVKFKSIKSSDL